MRIFAKYNLTVFILFIFLSSKTLIAQDSSPIISTKGIVEYFKIVDILKQDRFPTPEDWKQFNSSPGYKDLTEREFGENYLKDLITVAFKPSEKNNKTEVLDKYRSKGDYYEMFAERTLNSFMESDKYRNDILDFVNFISTPEFVKSVEYYLSEFIDNVKLDSTLRINFIVFDDSRGYEQLIIGIINPREFTNKEELCLRTMPGNIYFPTILLMAHESFHNIRSKQLKLLDPTPESGDKKIIEILNTIENEGIADQINVSRLYTKDGCLSHSNEANRINLEQKYQYAIIHEMDYFLTEISLNESIKQELSGIMESIITRSGHPTGYFISKIISSQLGNKELKRICLNPFQFIISYNKAAKTLPGTPQFSDNAINLIKKLESKYLINN